MRELKASEINEVSGAGVIADAGIAFGKGIGSIIEAAGVKGAIEAGTNLGAGIGQIIEATFESILSIFGKLFGK